MMLDILKDKRIWIGLAIALLFAIGIISAIHMINQSKKNVANIETDMDEDKPYDGDGMEVVEDNTESEDTMEVPESWEGQSENDNKSDEKEAIEDTSKSDSNKENSGRDDSNKGDSSKVESSEDSLKDETTEWGSIF